MEGKYLISYDAQGLQNTSNKHHLLFSIHYVLVTIQSVDALPSTTLLSLKFELRSESKGYDQKGSLDQSLSTERMGVDTYQNSMTQVRIFKEDPEEITHVNLLFYP